MQDFINFTNFVEKECLKRGIDPKTIDSVAHFDHQLTYAENCGSAVNILNDLTPSMATDKKSVENLEQEFKAQEFETFKDSEFGTSKLIEKMLRQPMIILIAGSRGAGKSSCAFRIAELIQNVKGNKIYLLNFPSTLKGFTNIEHPNEAEEESIIIADEVGVTKSARRSMSTGNLGLMEMMVLARHRGQTLIATVQNTALSDINVLRSLDILLLKKPSLMQLQFERTAVKKIYEEAQKAFDMVSQDEIKKYVFVYDETFQGLVKVNLPSFWTEDISRSWRKKETKETKCLHPEIQVVNKLFGRFLVCPKCKVSVKV